MTWVYIGVGLVLLAGGAELLVRGAAKLALRFGISSLAVGLTVVAYGTSAPELVVSTAASLSGKDDIAIGNAVGSNIFNVLFILGACALVAPLAVQRQFVRREVPVMIAVSVALLLLVWDRGLSRLEGVLLLTGLLVYTIAALRAGRRESSPGSAPAAVPVSSPVRSALEVVAGLAFLVWGARWFVEGSVSVARTIGVSEMVIGLTLVAAGTSLPEVATSIVATVRGQRDIAVGNVVGSNIYNILAILGVSAVVSPTGLSVSPALVAFDIPVMTAVAVACLPLFWTGSTIARWEGGVFLGYYVAYTAYLVLAAKQHDALATFSTVMSVFVVPLTALTILVVAARHWRARPRPSVS